MSEIKETLLYHPSKSEIKDFKDGTTHLVSLYFLNFAPGNPTNIEYLDLIHQYSKADLAKDFIPVFGKHACSVQGKYRRAQVYFFKHLDETILCTIEKGDRGTGWYWVNKNKNSSGYSPMTSWEDPSVAHFAISFLSKLNKQVYGNFLPPGCVSETNRGYLTSFVDREILEKHLIDTKDQKPTLPRKKI